MAASTVSAHSTATTRIGTAGVSAVTVTKTKPDALDRFRDPKVCEIPATNDSKPDIFNVLRPQPRTVLGYNISQTDTKVQRKVPTGITKLHVQQTEAQYELPPPGYVFPEEPLPPPPPPEPKFQYSTGRGPVWEFLDDIWRRKVEKQQIKYRQRLARVIAARKKFDKSLKAGAHVKLMKLIGPDWFQELSPKQLRTVDNLKSCIVKDVKNKSICSTQANIAELGLVLRPDPRHIKMALKKCCECPVEFLLILYQLMNRHRTEYSLNDRLLLSGVVHLTMRETLKELHIRIPSPPPPLKKPKTPVKKEKQKHYKSPYLVPFTFTPEPRKHYGIYKNNHIQYPESPYFSYISELKAEMNEEIVEEVKKEGAEGEEVEEKEPKIRVTKKQSGITDAQEKELVNELRVAQREYNNLTEYRPVPFLRKPSIYIPCDHGIKKPAQEEVEEEEEESSENETNATVSIEVRVTTDFDEYCQPTRKVCECRITFDETKVPKHREVESSSLGSIEEDEEEEEKEGEGEAEGLVQLEGGEGVKSKKTEEATKNMAVSTFGLGKQLVSTSSVGRQATADKQLNATEEKPKEEEQSEGKRDSKVEGSSGSAKSLQSEHVEEKLVTLGQRDSSECKCKEEVEKVIETNLCQCDKCKADREAAKARKKPTYVIEGMQEVRIKQKKAEDGEKGEGEEEGNEEGEGDQDVDEGTEETKIVPVIAGVKARKTCHCLDKYRARVKVYEEMKKRFDAQHDLMTLQQQYIIGGVTRTPTGDPVYMLSGVLPQRECPCAKAYQEQLKEEQRLANMPKIPLRKQKYIISGVRETEQGNVFIISGAAATEDCTCMKMYKSYEEKHAPCVQAYEKYLKKIQLDTQEYMDDLARDGKFGDVEPIASNKGDEETSTGGGTLEQSGEVAEPSVESEQRQSKNPSGGANEEFGSVVSERDDTATATKKEQKIEETKEVCRCGVVEENTVSDCQCGVIDDEDDLIIDTDLSLTLEVNKESKKKKEKDKKKVCICEPDYDLCICQKIDPSECPCGDDSSTETEETIEPEPELHRFTILDKIPCKLSEQLEIIKKALEVLAEDGFPLAKLPDSYKLPHFKLWMQLRCGKFWTQEDRVPLLMASMSHWRHVSYCSRKVRLPDLDISDAEAHRYTWAQAQIVKQMAMEKDESYYRKLRQAIIGDGREFFPSTFSYELPTPNFRDCYFAYTPSKEEDCVCWRPWYQHEIKDFSGRKSCL